jgi:hypothetical protein
VTDAVGTSEAVTVCVGSSVGCADGVAVGDDSGAELPVIVGTGERRAACNVPIRCSGLPVPGMSEMIWLKILSLIGGTSN